MRKQDIIANKFKRENLINIMAAYQLYYQITLGEIIEKSGFEKEKIVDLNLDIDPENVLNTMIEVINTFRKEDDFDSIFEDNMKINAMIHALKDFTLKYDELNKKENIYDVFYEKIMNDQFFTFSMQVFFSEELKSRIDYWKKLISNETAKELKQSALKII
jgi:hypothetical protein